MSLIINKSLVIIWEMQSCCLKFYFRPRRLPTISFPVYLSRVFFSYSVVPLQLNHGR